MDVQWTRRPFSVDEYLNLVVLRVQQVAQAVAG